MQVVGGERSWEMEGSPMGAQGEGPEGGYHAITEDKDANAAEGEEGLVFDTA